MDDINIKALVKKAGNKNRYQYITLIIIFFLYGTTEFITISLPYLETKPDVAFFDDKGIRHEVQINYTICETYKDKYNITKKISSMVSDTELYCDKIGTSLIGMSLFTGVMFGSLILYFFADMWGRKKTILIFSILYIGMLLTTYFVESIYVYYVTMFFSGLFYVIIILTSCILLNEAISEDLNAIFTTIIYNSFFAYGMGYGYLFSIYNWKSMFIIIAILQLIFVTIFYSYCEESLYFYITKNDKNMDKG